MPPPRHSVAPNDIQNIYPHAQRVPLGPSGYIHYGGTPGPGDGGYFWFYVPTIDAGTVLIELEGGPAKIRLEDDSNKQLQNVSGEALAHDLPRRSLGIYHVFVTPVRPVQVRYVCEGWPKELDQSGAETGPLIPWNFWYYPFNPATGKYRGAKGEFDSAAVQRSAMEKFDRACLPDKLGAAWHWEKSHHVDPKAESWEGHCDMASFASVYFEDPRPNETFKGVTFSRDELRFLATEWAGRRMHSDEPGAYELAPKGIGYASIDNKFVVWMMKPSDEITPATMMQAYLRVFPGADAAARARAANDAARIAPDAVRADFGDVGKRLLTFLIAYAKDAGRPVLGDFGPADPARIGIEVWNFVLVFFRAEWREFPKKDHDPRLCKVQLDVVTNVDEFPPDAPLPPATVGGNLRPIPVEKNHLVYRYQLEIRYDDNGEARWARFPSCITAKGEVYAPHMLFDVRKPGTAGGGNPFINDELINAGLLRLRPRFR